MSSVQTKACATERLVSVFAFLTMTELPAREPSVLTTAALPASATHRCSLPSTLPESIALHGMLVNTSVAYAISVAEDLIVR